MTNPVSNHDMKVFTGVSNPDLSKRLARYCGVTVSDADFCLHNNGDYHIPIIAFTYNYNLQCCWPIIKSSVRSCVLLWLSQQSFVVE